MWASHHDHWHPTFISKCIAGLESVHNSVLCYPKIQFINDNGIILHEVGENFDTINLDVVGRLHVYLIRTRINSIIYGLFRREALKPFMPTPTIWAADWWLMTQLTLKGHFVYIPEALFFFRDDFLTKTAQQRWETLHPNNKGKTLRYVHLVWAWSIIKAVLGYKISPIIKPFLILDTIYCLIRKNFGREIRYEIKSNIIDKLFLFSKK